VFFTGRQIEMKIRSVSLYLALHPTIICDYDGIVLISQCLLTDT